MNHEMTPQGCESLQHVRRHTIVCHAKCVDRAEPLDGLPRARVRIPRLSPRVAKAQASVHSMYEGGSVVQLDRAQVALYLWVDTGLERPSRGRTRHRRQHNQVVREEILDDRLSERCITAQYEHTLRALILSGMSTARTACVAQEAHASREGHSRPSHGRERTHSAWREAQRRRWRRRRRRHGWRRHEAFERLRRHLAKPGDARLHRLGGVHQVERKTCHLTLDWAVILEQTQSQPSSPEPRKRAWEADACDVTEFGGFALDDSLDVVVCTTCAKPVLRQAYPYHEQNCALAQSIAEGRVSPSILKSETKAEPEHHRKPWPTGGKKHRGPINLDRQCGVINNKGLPCSRSLTCKSHSMGAKRHVQGRSQPYDTLLFEWQKATNPAFVARLEEKERHIAALKASSQAHKERKRRTTDKRDAERTSADTPMGALDLYQRDATYQDVDRDLSRTLHAIHAAVTRDRTPIMPMATRSLAGQFTTRTKRCRVLRQFLAQGLAGTAHVRARLSEANDDNNAARG